jgi:hypothetical protein
MRAIFIDTKNRKVEECEFTGDYRDIQKKLGVDLFTAVRLEKNDTLYIDDEGLINGTEEFFFSEKLYPHPLAGNGLILGTSWAGNSVSAKQALEDIGTVQFMTRDEVRAWSQKHPEF